MAIQVSFLVMNVIIISVAAAGGSGGAGADGSCVVPKSAHVGGGSTDVSGGIQMVKVHPGIGGADVS